GGQLRDQVQQRTTARRGDGEQRIELVDGPGVVAGLQRPGGQPAAHLRVARGTAGGDFVAFAGLVRTALPVFGAGQQAEGAAQGRLARQHLAGDGGRPRRVAGLQGGLGGGQVVL